MKFIHFGCWNSGKCDIANPLSNGLSATMKKLNDYVDVNKDIEFISIAGDNYYPNGKKDGAEKKEKDGAEKKEKDGAEKKEKDGTEKKKKEGAEKKKKEKILVKDNLISGLECLPKNIKKYITLGNHEIEDEVLIPPDTTTVHRCKSLLIQQDYAAEGVNHNFDLFKTVTGFTIDNNSTLIIMIDTTLYELKTNDEIVETCYKYLFLVPGNENFKTIQDLINYQEREILNIISKHKKVKNLIIIGHRPLISAKKNKITEPIKLLNFITEKIMINNIYYLCADTHFYEKNIINDKITQYIVGTGGAEQDPLPDFEAIRLANHSFKWDSGDKTYYYNNIKVKIEDNKKTYGFIVVNIDDGNISAEFIESEYSDDIKGGYIAKIHKYTRKIELYNN